MKNIIVLVSMALLFGCTNNQPSTSTGNTTIEVKPETSNLGDNLDLQALGELVKGSANASDLEQALNKEGSINNLDLDGDGKVDYINVTEYPVDDNTKGFSFTVDLGPKGKQEIATVEIQKSTNNTASMNISGNQTVYGNNAAYSSNYTFADMMIMSWLWSPHSYYYSPYRYGYYPTYYHNYGCSPYGSYHSRMYNSYGGNRSTIKHTTTTTTTTRVSKSPNSSSTSSAVSTRSRSLSNPTSSQKSFSSWPSGSSTPSTNGFKSSSSSSSRPSSSSSSRSFGSSSRSSSSSRGGRR